MDLELRPGRSTRRGIRERLPRHVWIVILLLVVASIFALCGRSASAQNVADFISRLPASDQTESLAANSQAQ